MIRLAGVRLLAPAVGRLPGAPLLDGIDLSIRHGEYICLTGPNGAGKTLLLLVLAGLKRPSSGEIIFDDTHGSAGASGRPAVGELAPGGESPAAGGSTAAGGRRAVGIVFQSPDDQIVGSTVERDLAFGLENAAVEPAEIRRRVSLALQWSGLAPLARRPPHLLSEGEKQRLALTGALILEPDLLLLDEPTSRLDPDGRRLFLRAVHRAREESGAAVVHVTHRSDEILPADRIVGMRAGRVVFDGSPADLLRSPEADRLGILWSGLHQLHRELLGRGIDPGDCRGAEWNDAERIVARVGVS